MQVNHVFNVDKEQLHTYKCYAVVMLRGKICNTGAYLCVQI